MSAVGDTNVHVQVNGTTFAGIYETVGSRVELMSADFGDHSAEIGSGSPQGAVEQLLRNLAERAIRSGCVFVPDDAT